MADHRFHAAQLRRRLQQELAEDQHVREAAMAWLVLGPVRGDDLAAAGQQGRVVRFGDDDAHVRTQPAQGVADAAQAAAGAGAQHHVIEPAAGEGGGDFGAGMPFVHLGIGLVLELARPEPAMGGGQFARLLHHAAALEVGRRQHHAGAEEAHQAPAFDAELLPMTITSG